MPLDEPSWWYRHPSAIAAKLLQPAAALYDFVAARKLRRLPRTSLDIPVICIGNFTAGGTGKTPFAIWMAQFLKAHGRRPVFLSRGYGGRLTGPHAVRLGASTADDVGDEPLLLAAHAPAVISRDRGLGGQFIVDNDLGDVIVMDDGLQNSSLKKDLVISVVSASRGVGNGMVIPAGPLRTSLVQQLAITDVVLVNLDGEAAVNNDDAAAHVSGWLPKTYSGLIVAARVVAHGDITWLSNRPVFAYAGIGNPQRFFDLIEQCGGEIRESKVFRDHQLLSDADAMQLIQSAKAMDCQLVTTQKDLVRLNPQSDAHRVLQSESRSLDIEMQVLGIGDGLLRDKILQTVSGH